MAETSPTGAAERLQSRLQELGLRQQAVERHLARGLDVDQAGLMTMNLLLDEGPATPSELAHRLAISTAAMSLVLQRLDTAGHTTRSPHPSDRRKVIVTASSPSAAAALDLVQPLIEGIAAIAAGLDADEQRVVEDFLDQLNDLYARIAEGS